MRKRKETGDWCQCLQCFLFLYPWENKGRVSPPEQVWITVRRLMLMSSLHFVLKSLIESWLSLFSGTGLNSSKVMPFLRYSTVPKFTLSYFEKLQLDKKWQIMNNFPRFLQSKANNEKLFFSCSCNFPTGKTVTKSVTWLVLGA